MTNWIWHTSFLLFVVAMIFAVTALLLAVMAF